MTSPTHLLVCSDLDRTLLPNGRQEESPQARPLLRMLAQRPEVTLVYVSGRDKLLVHKAIEEYDIPVPDFAIGDVGATLYEVHGDAWGAWDEWQAAIAPDWNRHSRDDLQALFTDINELSLQEPAKQSEFKLSYYTPADLPRERVLQTMRSRLAERGIQASLIWSVDETADIGLLDVLPQRATKLGAVRFLMEKKGFDVSHTVFSGDSGNDLPVLTSGLQAVLVRNATDQVREEAVAGAAANGVQDRLYLAKGGFFGMNGNYSAGVLEGLAHFIPAVRFWLEDALANAG